VRGNVASGAVMNNLMQRGGLWTPSLITTRLWLDASDADTVTANETGRVSVWADKSGFGNHAVQNTEAAKPTYDLVDSITGTDDRKMVLPEGILTGLTEAMILFTGSQVDILGVGGGWGMYANSVIASAKTRFPLTDDNAIYGTFGTDSREASSFSIPEYTLGPSFVGGEVQTSAAHKFVFNGTQIGADIPKAFHANTIAENLFGMVDGFTLKELIIIP